MLGATYLLVAVIVSLAVPFGITLGRRLTAELGGRVEREAYAVAMSIEDNFEVAAIAPLQPTAVRFAERIGGRIVITDAGGTLVADSLDPPGTDPPNYNTRPEIADALSGEGNWLTRHSSSLGRDLLVSAVPVRSGGRILGAVRISYPMDEVTRSVRRGYLYLGAVAAVVLATGLGLSYWLSRWVVRPLRAAASSARSITAGDLNARVPVSGPEEVRELARDLNVMTDELADVVRANREFAADASHQLRTPLTALRLSLESAGDGGDPKREIAAALRQTERLQHTVDALLTMARAPASGAENVDLTVAAREAIASLPESAIDVVVDGQASVTGDRIRIVQTITNLIDNACRFASSRVVVSLRQGASYASVRVDDDGPGVAPQDRPRLFDRFFRGRLPMGEGSGLGLTVARELARVDGGDIRLAPSALGGACFEVVYETSRASSSSADANRNPTPRRVRI
jgi:signal transduction histidine kinase